MPAWFIGLFIVSLIGFVCSWSGDLVLATSIWTFGLMLPIWFVAANLWWLLLTMVPVLILRKRGMGAIGGAVSVTVLILLWIGSSALIRQARDELIAADPVFEPGLALLGGAPDSVEIDVQSDLSWGSGEDACGPVCHAVLSGPEVKWLRIRLSGGGQTVVFVRAEATACQALDPAFSTGVPCILARHDDGAKADLRIEITQDGDFWGSMQPNPGWVYLTGIQRVRLIDDRVTPSRELDERQRYGWSEPVIGPLVPGMTALGSGVSRDGPSFQRKLNQSEPIDLAAVLAHSGVQLGTLEPPKDSETGRAARFDAVLLSSILEGIGDKTLSPGQSEMARLFVDQARASLSGRSTQPFGAAERKVLRQLADMRGDMKLEQSLRSMMGEYPDAFFENFGALLQVVVNGTPQEAERAANAAGFGLFKSRRGDHDAAWADYVAAIESGRSEDLIRWIGRFNRDPLPVLRLQLQRAPTDKMAWDTLSAVCHIDPRWWPDLIPFYFETALGYLPKPGDTKWNGMEIHFSVRALVFLGRRDLAEDVVGRIDWESVGNLPDIAGSPGKLERMREMVAKLTDEPLGC